MRKNLIAIFIILLAVVASFGDGSADEVDSLGVHVDTLYFHLDGEIVPVHVAKAESLKIIDGILIECANQANYPHNDGVMEADDVDQ